MEMLNRLINEFNLSMEDVFQSPYYELLNVYELMSNKVTNLLDLKLIEEVTYILPADDKIDVSHLFEQLIYDFEYNILNYSELKSRFIIIFDSLREIKNRFCKDYSIYCSKVESDISLEEIYKLPSCSSNNDESYDDICKLIRQATFEARKGFALEQCEESFISLLSSTSDFITRAEIDSQVKYKRLVYKFLKPKYVIDLKGVYLNVRNFKIDGETKSYMLEDLEFELSNNDFIIHVEDIFEDFRDTYSDFFTKYHIFTSYALFSVLEYLFIDKFEFKRPYITIKGKQIYNQNEMIEQYLMQNKSIFIEELYDYLRRLKLSNAGLISIIDSMEKVLCFENEQKIIHWSLIDISTHQIKQIEEMIYEEVLIEGTMAITDLTCALDFPKLNIDWDEWFIYSLLRKYSNRLMVVPSSRQFKFATPVVSVDESIDDFELNYISEYRSNKKIYKPKNLDLEEIELEDVDELLNMEVF